MTSRPRQSGRFRAELQDLVFKLCVGVGGFLGLGWTIKHPPAQSRHPASACTAHVAHVFERCVNGEIASTLSSTIMTVLTPVLVGLVLGALAGVILAQSLQLFGRR